MFPAYTYTDPYPQTFPHQRESNSYSCHHYPGWEAMQPLKHPSAFCHLPFSGNTGHPNPTDQSGCCNHSHPLGYYGFMPPYSHIQPPPQPYYYGPYPSYADTYRYFISPPHYPVDLARYDYDKAGKHCCGCPNHTCPRRDDSSVKIEEQKPEKEQGNQPSSMVRVPYYPYPVMVAPPSYIKDNEGGKASELQPAHWNGWVPMDINSLKGMRQEGEEKQQSWQGENKMTPLACPMIWMPGHDKPEETVRDLKNINSSPKAAEEWPSKFRIIPLKLLENENRSEKPDTKEVEARQAHPEAVVEKETKANIKTIPVKQLEESNKQQPEKPLEKTEERKSPTHKRQKEDSGVKKASERRVSSPAKSSKMPPVCLRVDPLPKRKTASIRSPSPPGLEEKERPHEENIGGPTIKGSKEQLPKKKDVPVVEMKEKSSNKGEKEPQMSQDAQQAASLKDTSGNAFAGEAGKIKDKQMEEGFSKLLEGSGRTKEGKMDLREHKFAGLEHQEGDLQSKNVEEKKVRRRDWSQSDAAVAIQSAYRGFEVRRWQPLEKLRKIAQVLDQVGDVKRKIQNLEAASTEQDVKQMMAINETIMNLLLKLDTIQGLHPSVREVRKSVARELTSLQERLDTLDRQVKKEHKSANMEHKSANIEDIATERIFDDGAAYVTSSSPEVRSTSEPESLEGKPGPVAREASKEQEKVENNPTDGFPHAEVVLVSSPSAVNEPASEQGSLPADEDCMAEQWAADTDQERQADRASREGETLEGLAKEFDESFSMLKNVTVSSGNAVSSGNEEYKEVLPGKLDDSEVHVPIAMLKDETGNEEHKEALAGKEDRDNSEVQVPMDMGLVREGSCKPEEVDITSVSADEKILKLPSGDPLPEQHVEDLLEQEQQVYSQVLERVRDKVEDSGIAKPESNGVSTPSLEEASELEEAAVSSSGEPELSLDAGEVVVPPVGGDNFYNGTVHPLDQNWEQVPCEQEKVEVLSVVEGGGHLQKVAGVADDDNTSSEAPCPEPVLLVEDCIVEETVEEEPEMLAAVTGIQSTGEVPGCSEEHGTDSELTSTGEAARDMVTDVLSALDAPQEVAMDESLTSEQEMIAGVFEEELAPEPPVEASTNEADARAPQEEVDTISHVPGSHSVRGLPPTAGLSIEENKVEENEKDSTSKQEMTAVVLDEDLAPVSPVEAITNEADAQDLKEEYDPLADVGGSDPVTAHPPTADMSTGEKKLVEENEKLREMLERLLEAGKEHLRVISNLDGRVKDLERRLAQKKRVKGKRNRAVKLPSCKVP